MRGLAVAPVLLLAALCEPDYPPAREPRTLSWTGGPLVWPSALVRAAYRSSGKVVSAHMIATRAAIFGDQLFVAYPRFRSGVAATLARAPLLSEHCEPVFEPFPSWEAQDELCDVVDLCVDARATLWALDTGVERTLERPRRRRPPAVHGFDPTTGKQLFRVDLSELAVAGSRLQQVAADEDAQGRRFLYVADAGAPALVVCDVAAGAGRRLPLPAALAAGCSAAPVAHIDVLQIAVAEPPGAGKRVYLSALCGRHVFYVHTRDLQAGADAAAITQVEGEKPRRLALLGSDGRSALYWRPEGRGDVLAWDGRSPLGAAGALAVVRRGGGCLLATHAVLDRARAETRLLQSNFVDYLRGAVGVGAVHVLRPLDVCAPRP